MRAIGVSGGVMRSGKLKENDAGKTLGESEICCLVDNRLVRLACLPSCFRGRCAVHRCIA